jgi:hypothetical protein
MVQRAVKAVATLALLMAVVTDPAGASLLTNIGTAEISGDATPYNLTYDSGQSLFWLPPTTLQDANNTFQVP